MDQGFWTFKLCNIITSCHANLEKLLGIINMDNMKVEEATVADLQEILKLQKLAFQAQAEIYNDYSLPPLVQTIDEIQDEFQSHLFLKIMDNGIIIGSVRGYTEGDTCLIRRLIVHPDYQNQGIGTLLMQEIEKKQRDCKRFELFTGHKSKRNLHLYNKLEYKIIKEEPVNENLTLFHLEKINHEKEKN